MPLSRSSTVGTAVRLVVGLVWLTVPVWAFVTAADAIVHGHPAYPVLVVLAALVGVVLVVRAVRRRGRATTDTSPTSGATPPRRRWVRLSAWVAGLVVTALMVTVLVFGRPHGATPVAVQAMNGSASVSVAEDARTITLTPQSQSQSPSGVGVVFHPGARVDARAYVPLLMRLAEQGHPVVVAKAPLGVALLSEGVTGQALEDHPKVPGWVVAGHSLGGVVAARAAATGDARIRGLALWASYADNATRTDVVPVLSVYGTNDGLIPPDQARTRGPSAATFVPIEGAVHTSFSDYGTQSDDGVESVPHEVAQQQIADATLSFIETLSPPPAK